MSIRGLPKPDFSPACLRLYLAGAVLRLVLDGTRSKAAARRAVIRRLAGKTRLDQQRVKDAFAGRNQNAAEITALWRALGYGGAG